MSREYELVTEREELAALHDEGMRDIQAKLDEARVKTEDLRDIADQQRKERDHFQAEVKKLRAELEAKVCSDCGNTGTASFGNIGLENCGCGMGQMQAEIDSLRIQVERLRVETNSAYTDRSRVLALLAALYPSHLMPHNEVLGEDSWHQDWQTVLAIELPTGQATWHLHKNDVPLFNHITKRLDASNWDGHSTEEKNRRLALAAQQAASPTGKYELQRKAEYFEAEAKKFQLLVEAEGEQWDKMLDAVTAQRDDWKGKASDLSTDLKTWQNCLDSVRAELGLATGLDNGASIDRIIAAIKDRPTKSMWRELLRTNQEIADARDGFRAQAAHLETELKTWTQGRRDLNEAPVGSLDDRVYNAVGEHIVARLSGGYDIPPDLVAHFLNARER